MGDFPVKKWSLPNSPRKLILTKITNLYFVLIFVYLWKFIFREISVYSSFIEGNSKKPRKFVALEAFASSLWKKQKVYPIWDQMLPWIWTVLCSGWNVLVLMPRIYTSLWLCALVWSLFQGTFASQYCTTFSPALPKRSVLPATSERFFCGKIATWDGA